MVDPPLSLSLIRNYASPRFAQAVDFTKNFISNIFRNIMGTVTLKIYEGVSWEAVNRAFITSILEDRSPLITKYYGIPTGKVMKLIDVSPVLFENIEQYIIKRDTLRNIFNIPKNHVVLLFVGRVERLKGIDILLDALSKIRGKDVVAFIVGSVTDRKLTIVNITSDIRCKVKYLGPLVGSKLYNIYAIADIFVLPSRLETAPLTILEAQAFSLPIIATDVGDVSEGLEWEKQVDELVRRYYILIGN
jgi:glycosyltransferase involved in cell wall biosynthesis